MAKKAAKKDAKKSPSTTDLLGALAGATKKTKKKGKPARNILEIPQDVQELLEEFAEKKTVFDLVDSAFKPVKDDVKQAIWTEYCKLWYKSGVIPQNPKLEIRKDGKVDCEAMFILSQRFYPQVDLSVQEDESAAEASERARDTVVGDLCSAGIAKEVAEDFVDSEMDFAPEQGCRSFRELSRGHKEGQQWVDATDVEQSVATKMIQSLLNQEHDDFTDEERAAALYMEPNVTVKPDVLTRVVGRNGYARSAEEVEAFCAVVNPVYYVSRSKFAVSDNPVDRNHRLVGVVADIMGLQQEDGE